MAKLYKTNLSNLDKFIIGVDETLKVLLGQYDNTRPNPSDKLDAEDNDINLSNTEKKLSAGLMRVNHTGEICAQALYTAQALTASDKNTVKHLKQAQQEEIDHLSWCHDRLKQLDSHTSFLNPVWYIGSFAMGAAAGLCGDKINLGFLMATEYQVEKHLSKHLEKLPENDRISRCIVEQMRIDELEHAETAKNEGAYEWPAFLQKAMSFTSKIMTTIAYRI